MLADQDVLHLQVLADGVSDLIQVVRPDGSFLYVNLAWRERLGYSSHEVSRLSAFDIIHPDDRERCLELFGRALAGEKLTGVETAFVTRDGRTILAEGNVSCRFENGQPIATSCVFHDITERKRGEAELRQSEEHLRAVIDTEPECLKLVAADGTILEINAAGAAMLDVDDPRVLLGRNLFSLVAHEHVENVTSRHTRVINGYRERFEFEAVGLRGTRRWMESHGTPLRRGAIPEVVALYVTRDITDRKHADTALRASEERYRIIVENARDIIYRIDVEGRFTFCNPAVQRILGYSETELVGRCYLDLVRPDQRESVWTFYGRQLRDKTPTTYCELAAHAKDGSELWFGQEVQTVIVNGEVVGFQGICRDITERVRAEDERRRFEAKVQHAQKLESLGVLAGGIAHDFNNLLTVMVGNATLAHRMLPEDSETRVMMQEIEKAGRRAAELSQQMLAYSGRSRSVVSILRMDLLVQEMTELLESVVSKKAFLHFDLDPATLQGDQSQLRQVIMNLVTNASDALADEPGVISIRTGTRSMDAASLGSPYFPAEPEPGDFAYVEVEDNGDGMNEETLRKIFDPFFTTKFTGRGLGLAAVLGIVRAHRGTIKATSTLGKGTTIGVYLPSAESVPVELPNVPVSDWEHFKGSGVLLVVEDDEHVRSFARRVLADAGFEVRIAGDGVDGLEMFAQCRDEIRGILVDLTMPRLDGVQVLQRLRETSSTVPVLLMSGYAEQDAASRAAGLGVSGFLQKPFRPADLLAKVSQMLAASPDRAA